MIWMLKSLLVKRYQKEADRTLVERVRAWGGDQEAFSELAKRPYIPALK
ncbi:hypothetical protein [Paenibacillus guangzhouensis]|nr:hypothetical protein [Paenibacillus guangzhouensis]